MDEIILKIAKEHFHIETLEERKMDSLDFHEVSVGAMKDALIAAFKVGIEIGQQLS